MEQLVTLGTRKKEEDSDEHMPADAGPVLHCLLKSRISTETNLHNQAHLLQICPYIHLSGHFRFVQVNN